MISKEENKDKCIIYLGIFKSSYTRTKERIAAKKIIFNSGRSNCQTVSSFNKHT